MKVKIQADVSRQMGNQTISLIFPYPSVLKFVQQTKAAREDGGFCLAGALYLTLLSGLSLPCGFRG